MYTIYTIVKYPPLDRALDFEVISARTKGAVYGNTCKRSSCGIK